MSDKTRIAYFVSHPIQYQAPLLRRIAREPDIELMVFFSSNHSVQGYRDEGFGNVNVKWDTPLLEGYEHRFLPAVRSGANISFARPISLGILRALRSRPFDVVWLHGFWSVNAILLMLAAKLLHIPVIVRAEGTLIDDPRSKLQSFLRRAYFDVMRHFIAAVLPIGSANHRYWEHYLGPDFPAFPMPYAVDNAYFQGAASDAAQAREEFRKELQLARDRPVILYASKLMPRKRCGDLLDAYLNLQPCEERERPYLLIVGDGSERTALEQKVQKVGASDVRFLGFQNQSQLGRFFDLCDVFVLPSMYEPFGLVINEVMNAGRAVIASDRVSCYPDLVQDEVTGKVFRAGDVEDLTSALELLLTDSEMRAAMGARARERIDGWSFEADVIGLREALQYLRS